VLGAVGWGLGTRVLLDEMVAYPGAVFEVVMSTFVLAVEVGSGCEYVHLLVRLVLQWYRQEFALDPKGQCSVVLSGGGERR